MAREIYAGRCSHFARPISFVQTLRAWNYIRFFSRFFPSPSLPPSSLSLSLSLSRSLSLFDGALKCISYFNRSVLRASKAKRT